MCCFLQAMDQKVQAERQMWESERVAWESRANSFLTKHEQLEKDHQVYILSLPVDRFSVSQLTKHLELIRSYFFVS